MMNNDDVSRKIGLMFSDMRRREFALEELQKSLKCHIANVRRTRYNIDRYKRRCAVLEQLLNAMPPVQAKILLERNLRPNLKDAFYAERMRMPLDRYRELVGEANRTLADLLSQVEEWEKL